VIALGGIPNKAQVGDMGIDGRIYPVSATPKKKAGEPNPHFSQAFGFERLFCPPSTFSALFVLDV
jgi:hypothetical protein